MNLGQFHTRVARALARGTSLDTSIPTWVEEAVQDLESNYDFQYMKRWTEITVDPDADQPHIISLYNTPVKEVSLLRYYNSDTERWVDIKGPKNPQDRDTRPTGAPSSFWLNGVNGIVLDSTPDEELTLHAHLKVFSTWQPDQDTFEHFLIDRYRKLLLSQTVLTANEELRDPRLAQVYELMNQRAWTQVKVAEEALQYGGETGAQMDWEPPYDEFDPNFERS